MKTFVILLSCLVCCVTAGRLGLTQKHSLLDTIRQQAAPIYEGYTPRSASERQRFLLDVLLQVQKPLVNTELVKLGQELVTDPSVYVLPNDEILQQFLKQAANQEILGRNDHYNPADISNIRQLVGLQRFFVLPCDFYVFQKNVVYARLNFNAVMFVDALSLAIRERPDTQDLVLPPINEILPQLYYDNYVINSAQNVDYSDLIYQATRTNAKPSLIDYFGLGRISSLFQGGKYGSSLQQRRRQIAYGSQNAGTRGSYKDNEIPVQIVLPVGEQNGLATDLTNDIDLNVALKNIIIDQLTETVTEAVEGGQQTGGIGKYQQYYQQEQYHGQGPYYQQRQYYQQGPHYTQGSSYQQGPYYQQWPYYKQGSYYQQGPHYQQGSSYNQGPYYEQGSHYNQEPYYQQGPYHKQRSYYQQGPYSKQGPYYQQGSKYQQGPYYQQGEYHQQADRYTDANEDGYRVRRDQGGIYDDDSYSQSLERQTDSSKQGVVNTNELPKVDVNSERLLDVGRRRRVNAANSGYSYYGYPFYRQQNQYGYNDQEYGSSYSKSHGRQQNKDAQYCYYELIYGSSYPYGQKQNERNQYGYSKQEYPYGRHQYYGTQYGNDDQKYSYGSYPYGRQQNQKYDSSNLSGRQQNQGAQYGYSTQGQQQEQYQRQHQQTYPYGQQNIANFDDVTMYNDDENKVVSREVRDTHNHEESDKRKRSGDRKHKTYRYTEAYRELEDLRGEIVRSIAATQQLSYSRRGEILLHTIQELAARLNIQHIVENTEGARYQQQQNLQLQQKIAQVTQQLRKLIDQVCQEAGIDERSEETLDIVASIINGKIIFKQQQLSIEAQRTLQSLQQQIQRIVGIEGGQVNEVTPLALLVGNLRNPVTQQTIISLAKLINEYRQQLKPYTQDQLSSNGDIVVQNVVLDPLVTYTEFVDADLVNLIDQQILQSNANNLQRLSKKVVARQQRLNHEPFTVSIDIQSQRPQKVEIRILLGPQIDYNGHHVSLAENRHNFIVIDAFAQQLQGGYNKIQRYSQEFNGYSNDVSTISEIYRQILTGQKQKQQYGTIRQLPQHLLLPRGTTVNGGLPVQIIVVVTPLTQQDLFWQEEGVNTQQISGFGIASVGLDRLPLGYPLDRQIIDVQNLNVPNILTTETVIQYDSRIRA